MLICEGSNRPFESKPSALSTSATVFHTDEPLSDSPGFPIVRHSSRTGAIAQRLSVCFTRRLVPMCLSPADPREIVSHFGVSEQKAPSSWRQSIDRPNATLFVELISKSIVQSRRLPLPKLHCVWRDFVATPVLRPGNRLPAIFFIQFVDVPC